MEIKIKNLNKAYILLIFGTGLFFTGAIGFAAGYLTQEQISPIAAMALLFVGAGSSKRMK